MPYAQLDIHFDESPSHADLELEHFGLMACAIAHCNRLLTDGFVSDKAVRCFGASGKGQKVAARLVEKGKWEKVEGGYVIVGYLAWNPSRAEVEAKLQTRAAAGRRGGLRSGETRSKNEASASRLLQPNQEGRASGKSNPSSDPDPHSDPTPDPEERPRRAQPAPKGSRIPADFRPKPETVEALRAEGHPDPLQALPKFRDFWTAKAGKDATKLDWEATFRNWVRNDKDRQQGNKSGVFARIVQPSDNRAWKLPEGAV